MPQLDVSTYASQLFWLAITFFSLYLILARIAIPKISTTLAERNHKISGSLECANKIKIEAEEMISEYEETLAQARTEARERYTSAAQTITQEISAQQKKSVDALNAKLHDAENTILKAKVAVKKELEKQTLELAADILQKLTGQSYKEADLKKYAGEF